MPYNERSRTAKQTKYIHPGNKTEKDLDREIRNNEKLIVHD